jgi:hypothetical protein
MPTRTPVVRVQLDTKNGRRHFELTATQVRALTPRENDPSGLISEAIPFATAESLRRKGLAVQRGPQWYVTKLGREVGRRARAKQARLKA